MLPRAEDKGFTRVVQHVSSIFLCVGVMYSGEYDVCDVTLSVHPHRASSQANFSACSVWIHTQSNITNIM